MKSLIFLFLTTLFSSAKPTVVIDAGHGGRDSGGAYGKVYEKHLALDTSIRLEHMLKKRGYKTVMTRKSDVFLSLGQRVSISHKYENSIFVSIHYNFSSNRRASGVETFYFSKKSKTLSNLVQKGMLAQEPKCKNRGSKYARYYVIHRNQNPSILVECGFVSNRIERDKMKSANFRHNLALGIANGIEKYNKNKTNERLSN